MSPPIPLDEAALPGLLAAFYGRVRLDPLIGPVFNDAVADWDEHLERLGDFWSSVMLTTGRYKGNPMVLHRLHADRITRDMFPRWLALWTEVTEQHLPPETAAALQTKAQGIASALAAAVERAAPPTPYRSTIVFDQDSLPEGLQRAHSTRDGVWGVIRVLEGRVRYHIEDGSAPPQDLTPATPGLIQPAQPHHVEPLGPMRMQVEFYDREPILNP